MREYAIFSPMFWCGETGRMLRGNPGLVITLDKIIYYEI
jgi:hypothetical protein